MTPKNSHDASKRAQRSFAPALSRTAARNDSREAFAFTEDETLILDRYRPLETLGSGGYGTVFAAWDEQLKRRVALKEIPLTASSAGVVDGLEEARTAALLNHPNIASVYDFITTDDRAYLIMEYIDGVTLADIPSDALNDDTIATIAKSAASAIAHAHKNGVLHLDIKPRNILINHEGRVKLIDFGIAELSGLSGHGSASGGTIGYMPLEQLEGDATSEATDEWAFAAVIYELCTDEFPYAELVGSAPTLDMMLKAQLEGEPSLLETNDTELNEIFARALATDPAQRYSSIKAMSTALLERLGDATQGRHELKEVVEELTDDEDDEPEVQTELDVVEREPLLSNREIASWAGRFFVALLVGMALWQLFARNEMGVAAGQLSTTDDGSLVPVFVSFVAAALVLLAPRLGGIIAPLSMAALLIAGKQASELWPFGAGLALVASAHWYFIGRKDGTFGALNALFATIALEINLLSNEWLAQTYPSLFADRLMVINLSLAAAYVLVSMVGAWFIYKRKDVQ